MQAYILVCNPHLFDKPIIVNCSFCWKRDRESFCRLLINTTQQFVSFSCLFTNWSIKHFSHNFVKFQSIIFLTASSYRPYQRKQKYTLELEKNNM